LITNAIRTFEKASGARINLRKSKALAIGRWETNTNILDITYQQTIKTLGVYFSDTIRKSIHATWTTIIGKVRAKAKEAYMRELCLAHRIAFIYLLSKIWYAAQTLPPLKTHTQQIASATTQFIWKGTTFRVPISTLQKAKTRGGWELNDVNAKCKALLYYRMFNRSRLKRSTTAALLQEWELTHPLPNPPFAAAYTHSPVYVRNYAIEMAYINPPPNLSKATKPFHKHIYWTLRLMEARNNPILGLRIEEKNPNHNWPQIWSNLHNARMPETIRSVWYTVKRDIIPTYQRLYKIALVSNDRCNTCGKTDTLLHRITECGTGSIIWNWTQNRMAKHHRKQFQWNGQSDQT
jgi:hypothetical protein